MREALRLARAAAEVGDVPVGAVVICSGEVVGRGGNAREVDADPTGHAEVVALRGAAKAIGRWNLSGCDLYVTLEPCAMCAGAIILARISRLVYGASDPKAGACGSALDVLGNSRLNHRVEVVSGVQAKEAGGLLRAFFAKKRSTGGEVAESG
ncbi:MAG TPA: tRNA adenosine(34) deaminase TadA [Armatimonadota bacterium]|nr:tRNA adenosine(34) deaminase TadA [Armatimonadota bacterium]